MLSLKVTFLFFSLFFSISSLPPGVFFPSHKGILYLTDETLDEASNEFEYILISAFSDNCGTCVHKISPSFENLYQILQTAEPELKDRVAIAKIRGKYNENFMDNYNLWGYPNVVLLRKKEKIAKVPERYSPDELLIFLRKHILKPVQFIKDKEHYEKLLKNTVHETLITYFGNNKEEIKSLQEVGENTKRGITFVNLQNIELIKEFNATAGQLSINKDIDEKFIIEFPPEKDERWTTDNIKRFIDKYNHKVIIKFDNEEGEELLKNRKDFLLVVFKIKEEKEIYKLEEELKEYKTDFYELAKKVRDIIQSTNIYFLKEKTKKNKANQKKANRKRELDLHNDPFGIKAEERKREETQRNQQIFVSKLKLNDDKRCEIKLVNIDKAIDEPVFYTLPCGKENIEKNFEFILNWKNKNISEDNDIEVEEIDLDYLIFDK